MTQPGPDTDVWTVADLAAAARALLDDALPATWVRGEVSGFKAYGSGHWYFTLKDDRAQVRAVMWKSANRGLPPPAEGTEVFAWGRAGLYEERGEFRLDVKRLVATSAVGAAEQARERVKQALLADGLLDASRKRPLPAYPRRIALVTSADGAALRDMLTVARARWPLVELLLVPTRVQGSEAAREVVAALARVARLPGVDVCIVGRGGGSREDLAVFDVDAVCRAVAASPVPVISAVGHETDVALTDLVADVRAATPSAAMERVLPDRAEVAATLDQLGRRLAGGLARRTGRVGERLSRSEDRLEGAVRRLIERVRGRLDRAGTALDALSPLRVLERGYAVARGADGRVLRRVADVHAVGRFSLRVADGEVGCRVEGAA